MKTKLLFCTFLALPAALVAGDAGSDFLAKGKLSLNARLRYEGVEQTGLLDAAALTLRTRVGFTTGDYAGFKASVEGENILAADGDRYNQSGLNPVAARRAVVGDPDSSEINQAWLSYTTGKTAATIGRQRLVLDNQRFIGDVGWRQNQQTFDGFVVQDKTLDHATLTYAYLDRINRVLGERHPQGHWNSKSHVLNAARAGLPGGGTLVVYGYWLDFANSSANSCATWGASYTGARKLSDTAKLAFRAELAGQTDHGSSKLDYQARYWLAEAGVTGKPGSASLGHEVLGSDNNIGFKTPLATLHAFNGWSDLFLATPAAGLVNTYVKGTANLPEGFAFTAFYHWFEADANRTKFGQEFDAMLTRKFGQYVTAAVKYADFRGDSPAFPHVRKVWVQLEYVY